MAKLSLTFLLKWDTEVARTSLRLLYLQTGRILAAMQVLSNTETRLLSGFGLSNLSATFMLIRERLLEEPVRQLQPNEKQLTQSKSSKL